MEASIASIEEGGVGLRGSMGSNCQQYTGKYLHCSSVAWLLLTLRLTPPSSMLAMLAMLASMAMLVSMDTHMLPPLLSLCCFCDNSPEIFVNKAGIIREGHP